MLLSRKIFWRIPVVGNVYGWMETRFRWTTVMLLTSTSNGPWADLPVDQSDDLRHLVLPSSDSALRRTLNNDPEGLPAVELEAFGNTELSVKDGGQSKDSLLKTLGLAIICFKFIYDGNSRKTFEGGWGLLDRSWTMRSGVAAWLWGNGWILQWS